MLQKTKMVAKKYLEKLYDSTCNVVEYQEVQRANRSTGFEEVVVLQNQPCKLSFEGLSTTNNTDDNGSNIPLSTKLFISPSVTIKPGSKIIVSKNNLTTAYKSSGVPAFYDTHQEIMLELFKEWS